MRKNILYYDVIGPKDHKCIRTGQYSCDSTIKPIYCDFKISTALKHLKKTANEFSN